MYAIVDIETTGGASSVSRITEVAVVVFDGQKIVRKYHSLVNPETEIPRFITALTGIDNRLVKDAPTFREIASEIREVIGDHIFIAHNVNFDHSFLKAEFVRAGMTFNKTRLCTIRLARKIIPGLGSYGLGSVCRELGIINKARHRALGDAEATAELFKILLEKDKDYIISAVKRGTGENILPPNVSREDFRNLPTSCGVYYFHDSKGKVLYVGKANNIRQRVSTHFGAHAKGKEKHDLINRISRISFSECGTELISLLLESAEIRRLWPPFNNAQKRPVIKYGVYLYEDRRGFQRFGINKVRRNFPPLASFPNEPEARSFLTLIADDYDLCHRLCNLQTSAGKCEGHKNGNCKGACTGDIHPSEYNRNVRKALKIFEQETSYILYDRGRSHDEYSFVVMENGEYRGFGFNPEIPETLSQALAVIQARPHSFFEARLINSFFESGKYEGFIEFRNEKKKAAPEAAFNNYQTGLFAGLRQV